jgi:hypothetical protein
MMRYRLWTLLILIAATYLLLTISVTTILLCSSYPPRIATEYER